MSAAPETRLVLRPRGVLESADLALRLLVLHAKPFARLTAWVCIPGWLLTMAARYVAGWEPASVWIVGVLLATWAEGPFTTLSGAVAIEASPSALAASKTFLRRAVRYAWFRTIALLAGVLAFLALIAPWFFAAPSLLFVPEVVLLERADRGVFGRVGRVVASAAGRALGTSILLVLVRVVGALFADAVLQRTVGTVFDVRAQFETLGREGISPYALAGLWLSVPLCAMLRYAAYIDLRTLREGWDVQRRFQVLATRLEEVES